MPLHGLIILLLQLQLLRQAEDLHSLSLCSPPLQRISQHAPESIVQQLKVATNCRLDVLPALDQELFVLDSLVWPDPLQEANFMENSGISLLCICCLSLSAITSPTG